MKLLLTGFLLLFSTIAVQANNCLDFDGVADTVTTSSFSKTTFSLEVWINPDNIVANQTIISTLDEPAFKGFELHIANGIVNFTTGSGSAWGAVISGSVLTLSTWTHIAVTYENGVSKMYIDGSKVAENVVNAYVPSTSTLTIGERSNGQFQPYCFDGRIDEVKIWSKVLSELEIKQNMSGVSSTTPNLERYYKFDDGVAGGDNSILTEISDATGAVNGALKSFALTGTTSNFVAADWKANKAPTVLAIGDKERANGEYFFGVYLDNYVEDETEDSKLIWSVFGAHNVSVSISSDRVATFTYPTDFLGADTILFVATDEEGLSDSSSTIISVINYTPKITQFGDRHILAGSTFESINLDLYVQDSYENDSTMIWTVSGDDSVQVSIHNRIATINYSKSFIGRDTVLFKVNDRFGAGDSCTVIFSVGLNPFTVGDGSEGTPFEVSTIEQLNGVRYFLSSHFILKNDLDFNQTPFCSDSSSVGWLPLGDEIKKFTGSFNGNGYVISNLFIDRPSTKYIGLFGYVKNATIEKIGLEDVQIRAENFAGGLVGFSVWSKVSNSYVTGSLSDASNVAGLVGFNSYSTIRNCYFNGTVSGVNYVGGLVGSSVGESEDSTKFSVIENSYAIGSIVGTEVNKGALVSFNRNAFVYKSYFNSETSVYPNGYSYHENGSVDIVGKLTSELLHKSTFVNWEFDSTWAIDERCSYPYLSWQKNYVIVNNKPVIDSIPHQNKVMGHAFNAIGLDNYVSDLNNVDSEIEWFVKNDDSVKVTIENRVATMSCSKSFLGADTITFLAKDSFGAMDSVDVIFSTYNAVPIIYTIYDQTILRGEVFDSISKFDHVSDQNESSDSITWSVIGDDSVKVIIENGVGRMSYSDTFLGSDTVTFIATDKYGASDSCNAILTVFLPFAGGKGTLADPYQIATVTQLNEVRNYRYKHYILTTDLDFAGSIYDSLHSFENKGWQPIGDNHGKFFGTFNGASHIIKNLYINEPTTGYSGLFGIVDGALIESVGIENSNVKGEEFTGALVGKLENSIVNYCYSTGDVIGESNVGGLIGSSHQSKVNNSYSSANVTAIDDVDMMISNEYTGGLIGSAIESPINNCYSVGKVTGKSSVGGLIGNNSSSTITNSYYNSETSTQSDTGKGDAKTTSEMLHEASFINWNFTTFWNIEAYSSYPYFAWQKSHYIVNHKPHFTQSLDQHILSGSSFDTITVNDIVVDSNGFSDIVSWTVMGHDSIQTNVAYPVVTFSYSNSFLGSDTLTFIATDTYGASDTAVVIFSVSNATPNIDIDGQIIMSGTAFDTLSLDENVFDENDADSTLLLSVLNGKNISVTIDSNRIAVIHYAPTFVGIDTVTFIATDRFGASDTSVAIFCVYKFSGGDGTAENPYEIRTIEELNCVRFNLYSHYILMNDLDFATFAQDSDSSGWIPIGYEMKRVAQVPKKVAIQAMPLSEEIAPLPFLPPVPTPEEDARMDAMRKIMPYFSGSFNGKGFVIKNLYINRPAERNVGLFGYAMNATIDSVGIENCSITGGQGVGALVGTFTGTSIKNSHSTGKVHGTENVGGMVGDNEHSEGIFNCYSTANVSGEKSVGGLAGINAVSKITNCYTSGSVSGTEKIGGLVGLNGFASIQSSYSKSSVNGAVAVGGLVGEGVDMVSMYNSYASGEVNGKIKVGGLVGVASQLVIINNCYAVGGVSGKTAGGLVGETDTTVTVTASFYDRTITRLSDDTGKGTPKSTTEMMSKLTFSAWPMDSIWKIDDTKSYPYLAWQRSHVTTNHAPTLSSVEDITFISDSTLVLTPASIGAEDIDGDSLYFIISIDGGNKVSSSPFISLEIEIDSVPIGIIETFDIAVSDGYDTTSFYPVVICIEKTTSRSNFEPFNVEGYSLIVAPTPTKDSGKLVVISEESGDAVFTLFNRNEKAITKIATTVVAGEKKIINWDVIEKLAPDVYFIEMKVNGERKGIVRLVKIE